jgi:cytochrome c-type biogenesis protein CcmH/NrfF
MRYFIQFLLLLALINPIYAESIEANTFINAQQERRYRTLIDEIRINMNNYTKVYVNQKYK